VNRKEMEMVLGKWFTGARDRGGGKKKKERPPHRRHECILYSLEEMFCL